MPRYRKLQIQISPCQLGLFVTGAFVCFSGQKGLLREAAIYLSGLFTAGVGVESWIEQKQKAEADQDESGQLRAA